MEAYQQIIALIALSMGTAWASGLNLYATLLVLGLGATTGQVTLPPGLEMVSHPLVIGAAGLMYAVEFFADKVPGVDTFWDTLHTFVRIPAGAVLAAGAVGEMDPALGLAAAIVGGGVAASSHLVKAGSRVLINTSPEPVSNWGASITEDVAVIGGMYAALFHPAVFLGLLVLFALLTAWLLPKIWRGIKALARRIGRIFGRGGDEADAAPAAGAAATAPANADATPQSPAKSTVERA
ncbi:DUF4126 domain-containing protein [Magnetofaba australis]|uniref:Putative transmembrane protein n=1 Tax=Magnetofaba australis IT-1 TaxID=1434232 RepID=A0A1Y2K0B3_9PROT|nr:DUF4126 domain-containing protein [Magnetofaba australis]OSM00183.1 putative transmembrane protein [Magnetofaba australis IT-1]